jgi:hypothetical protein
MGVVSGALLTITLLREATVADAPDGFYLG